MPKLLQDSDPGDEGRVRDQAVQGQNENPKSQSPPSKTTAGLPEVLAAANQAQTGLHSVPPEERPIEPGRVAVHGDKEEIP